MIARGALVALLAAGCRSPSLQDLWVLRDDGLLVYVTASPYGVAVWSEGELLLETTPGGAADGYAPVAFAYGDVAWTQLVSPGYFGFDPDLEPWQDDWVVVGAESQQGHLELHLVAPGDEAAYLAGDVVPVLEIDHTVDAARLRVEAELRDAEAPRAWSVGFASPAGEGFLGLGERFNKTEQRGETLYVWAEEGGIGLGEGEVAGPSNPSPNGAGMSYYPVPFMLSTQRYAFWLDETGRSTFELASARDDAWRVWSLGPELAWEVYVPIPGDPRPWPYHLIDRFTEAVGRPALPPPWAFGPRRRVGRGDLVDGVPEIAAMRDHDLALTAVDDAVHFLPGGSHVGVEGELAAWTASARALGLRVLGYYNPYVEDDPDGPLASLYQEGEDAGFFLVDGDGETSLSWLVSGDLVWIASVDFTSPEATEWYQGMLKWAVDLGYSGWMTDFGEYVQPDVVTPAGLDGEALHNLYPVLYQRAASRMLDDSSLAGDWLLFARSGFTGASGFVPFVWTGDPAASFEDADGLPSVVRATLNLGVSGVPHSGSDIGGFHCVADGAEAADGELLTRWIQVGAMMSNMQDQNACNGSVDGEKASIWTSPDAYDAWKTYARLHTRLFPYFYQLAIEATQTGAPVARQLFLEHPDEPELAAVDDAWYVGPSLLVAPVLTRGARARTVRFPRGRFVDWRTGDVYEGPSEAEVDAPLAELPLFLRAGGLIPMLEDTVDTLSPEANPEVIGPDDVAGRYDVVGALEPDGAQVTFTDWAGGSLSAVWSGDPVGFDLPVAANVEALRTCEACWLVTPIGEEGLVRVRVSGEGASYDGGGLRVAQDVGRRVAWDLLLLPE